MKYTLEVRDGAFEATKTSVKLCTHAVLGERARDCPGHGKAGDTLVLRWSGSERMALAGVKEYSNKSWGGAWLNVRVRPVTVLKRSE